MMIKVCGMREAGNIAETARLAPDLMGFIFYERSPRHAGEMPPASLDPLPGETRRVGVFVDAPLKTVIETARKYRLDLVQLHGTESPEMCAGLRSEGLGVIKAFRIGSREDVERAGAYEGVCDLYIFDTLGAAHGGTGQKFDHSLLAAYGGKTPYLLSGGLGPEDAADLAATAQKNPLCAGFDINSCFEVAPGIKDPAAIEQFIKTIKKPTL